jgi:hypothetical protein
MELAQDRPPPSGVLDIRGAESTITFQELIKGISCKNNFVRNESAWKWLRIVFIGGLFVPG